MTSPNAMPPLSATGSTASSSGLNTPEPNTEGPMKELGGESTPTSGRKDTEKGRTSGGDKREMDKAKMPPPPLPVTTVHAPTPPRMARMPSLSEISSHLHIPSPLSATPKTPSRSALLTTPITTPSGAGTGTGAGSSATSPTSATGFTASPSGRLKLPASAMTRTRSGSSGSSLIPTLASLGSMSRGASNTGSGMERQGSFDGGVVPLSAPASKNASPESAKASPMTPADPFSPEISRGEAAGSLRRQPSREYIKGYKDVPSLAAIRQRISCSHGSDGSRPGAEVGIEKGAGGGTAVGDEEGDMDMVETLLEDLKVSYPQNDAASSKGANTMAGHRLSHSWTLYFDAKGFMPALEQSAGKDGGRGMGDYEKSLLHIGRIDTTFAQYMNNLRLPSRLKLNSNYHLFKGDIRPMWEDPANSSGGKWVILFRQAHPLLDIAWANLTMALVGQILDPDDIVCGIVASNRPKIDRLQLWTRGRDDVDALNALGRRCVEIMGLEKGEMESVSVEFQYNASNVHPPANAFFHIPFASRNFSSNSPSTPSRPGGNAFQTLNLPSSGNSTYLSPTPPSLHASPVTLPSAHPVPLPLNPRATNLNVNIPVPHPAQHQYSSTNATSPLSHNTRMENRPISPGITPTPSPKMGHPHALPRPPDSATIKASMLSTSPGSGAGGGGGIGMRRMGSGQGSNAFAGPMAGTGSGRSPRLDGSGRLAPPSPVPADGV